MTCDKTDFADVEYDDTSRRISGVIHDVNNFLGVILGMADLMTHEIPGDQTCHVRAVNIMRAVERSSDLLRSLRTDALQDTFARNSYGINMLIDEVVDQLRFSRSSAKISVSSEMTDDIIVHCSAAEVGAAIFNVCANALEAMHDGGTLHITTRLTGLGGDGRPVSRYVEILFRDTGRGIHPEIMKKIFTPGFSTKNQFCGEARGMGLYRVRECMRAHGGTVTVNSENDKGTEVILTLPIVGDGLHDSPLYTGRNGAGATVVLMDEDELRSLIIRSSLENVGMNVIRHAGCKEAAEWLETNAGIAALVIIGTYRTDNEVMSCIRRMKAVQPGLKFILCEKFAGCSTDEEPDVEVMKEPLHVKDLHAAIDRLFHSAEASGRRRDAVY